MATEALSHSPLSTGSSDSPGRCGHQHLPYSGSGSGARSLLSAQLQYRSASLGNGAPKRRPSTAAASSPKPGPEVDEARVNFELGVRKASLDTQFMLALETGTFVSRANAAATTPAVQAEDGPATSATAPSAVSSSSRPLRSSPPLSSRPVIIPSHERGTFNSALASVLSSSPAGSSMMMMAPPSLGRSALALEDEVEQDFDADEPLAPRDSVPGSSPAVGSLRRTISGDIPRMKPLSKSTSPLLARREERKRLTRYDPSSVPPALGSGSGAVTPSSRNRAASTAAAVRISPEGSPLQPDRLLGPSSVPVSASVPASAAPIRRSPSA